MVVADVKTLAAIADRLESTQEQRFAAITALRSKMGAKYKRQSWVETTLCSSLAARGALASGVLTPVLWLLTWAVAWTIAAESVVRAADRHANSALNAAAAATNSSTAPLLLLDSSAAAAQWSSVVTVFEDAELLSEAYVLVLTTMSFLLVFRINRAGARWYEARGCAGRMILETRHLAAAAV